MLYIIIEHPSQTYMKQYLTLIHPKKLNKSCINYLKIIKLKDDIAYFIIGQTVFTNSYAQYFQCSSIKSMEIQNEIKVTIN